MIDQHQHQQSRRDKRIVSIPCSPTEWVDLDAPWPLTPAEWNQLLVLLKAMRPGLVAPDDTRREGRCSDDSQ